MELPDKDKEEHGNFSAAVCDTGVAAAYIAGGKLIDWAWATTESDLLGLAERAGLVICALAALLMLATYTCKRVNDGLKAIEDLLEQWQKFNVSRQDDTLDSEELDSLDDADDCVVEEFVEEQMPATALPDAEDAFPRRQLFGKAAAGLTILTTIFGRRRRGEDA